MTIEDQLTRPTEGAWLAPRRVRVDGPWLTWMHPVATSRGLRYRKLVRPGPGLLPDFVALADGDDREARRYASRWGVLDLCEHALPDSHSAECKEKLGPMPYREPLAGWRLYAGVARVLTEVGASLRQRQPAADTQIATLIPWTATGLKDGPPFKLGRNGTVTVEAPRSEWSWPRGDRARMLRFQRGLVGDVLDSWLALSGTRAFVSWPRDELRPRLEYAERSLFAAIALQLALDVSGAQSLVTCSNPECGRRYAPHPNRPARPSQRHYCPDCRTKKIPERDASRDYRSRARS